MVVHAPFRQGQAIGVRERAIAEYDAAVGRLSMAARTAERSRQHDRQQHTEELLRVVLRLELSAPLGYVELDGIRIGAWQMSRVGNHWQLCVLEQCRICGQPLVTPLVAGYVTLGALIHLREAFVAPQHPPELGCRENPRAFVVQAPGPGRRD